MIVDRPDLIPADPCDPGNPDVRGKMCVPNTATVIPAEPCDPISFDDNTGWLCLRHTAVVLVDGDDFKRRAQDFIKPAVYEGSPPGAWIIPDYNTYDCSMGGMCGERWCTSSNQTCACDPCGADASPEGAKNGWYCKHNWSTICIDPWGQAVINANANTTTRGKAIPRSATRTPTSSPISSKPTSTPTSKPTNTPTNTPTTTPTNTPTTREPTRKPTTPLPTRKPSTAAPSRKPTTLSPSKAPTPLPTRKPSTAAPSRKPTTLSPSKDNDASSLTSAHRGVSWAARPKHK